VEPTLRGLHFRQIVGDSVAHARYNKTFFEKYPLVERELIKGVRVTTRFASYQDWRAALLADFYDGCRLHQLITLNII
jgi:hypothetical protein